MPNIPKFEMDGDAELGDVLQAHADALVAGQDNTQELLEHHPSIFSKLEQLLHLARRISQVLVSVEPSPQFVSELKVKLGELQAKQEERWNRRIERATRLTQALGLVVSVLALAALVTHFIGSIVMVVALLVGRRRRKAAAA